MANNLLSIFDSNGKPSREILSLITEATLNQFPTIHQYLHDNNLSVDAKQLARLRAYIQNSLADQCRKHAFVMYRLFESSGNWNDGPDYQVKLSFGKNLLKLSPADSFEYEHLAKFEELIKEAYSEFGLTTKTESAIQLDFNNWRPTLFGKQYPLQKNNVVNKILHFVGSKYVLHMTKYKKGIAVIWGHAKIKKIGIYTITRFTDELIRSPSFPVANAASVLDNEIMTRQESMRTVFHQKWAPIITSEYEDWRVQEDPYWNISYGIRQHTLRLYNWAEASDLPRIEDELVQEMEESIIYHEIGHTVIREIFLPIENIGIGLGATQYNCYFYDGIYELLADFAPKHKLGHGAMAQMIKISKTSPTRAERMFYTYLSDVWFFDTEDKFMYDYASLAVLCMLRYIKDDRSIDFTAMAKDMTYQEDRTQKKQLTMIERVQELFIWDTDEIGSIAKKTNFQIDDVTWSFQQMVKDRLHQARKTYPEIDPEGYHFLQPFWTNMYSYFHHFTGEEQKVRNLLTQSVKKNLMKFLVLSCGRKKAEDYQFDHMKYIVDRCFEVGLVAYPTNSRSIIS